MLGGTWKGVGLKEKIENPSGFKFKGSMKR